MGRVRSNGQRLYIGDIHNHCGLSYGFGSIDAAFENARMQLDFVSVTGHASWPDMPRDEARLESVVEYHERGFERFEKSWQQYAEVVEAHNQPGRFVTFPSFEWHSMGDGDYVLYYSGAARTLFTAATLDELRSHIGKLGLGPEEVMLVPHHIGYRTGRRGINWESYQEGLSPIIEIISMHGCAESDDGPIPYMHTMGPRIAANTMQGGLDRGRRFGVIGSTDHHNAHPGSYGHGRAAVWADGLTREDIWRALGSRRSYALTGDRIELDYSLNGTVMGGEAEPTSQRDFEIDIVGGYSLDHVELLRNNRVIRRWDGFDETDESRELYGKLLIEVGWGETNVPRSWNVHVQLDHGEIVEIEPRFRGMDIVDPEAELPGAAAGSRREVPEDPHRLSSFGSESARSMRFRTWTFGNPTPSTQSTQAVSLEIRAERKAKLIVDANGTREAVRIADLLRGSTSFYAGGFLSGAVHLHRFSPSSEYEVELTHRDERAGKDTGELDFYYVRAAQRNGQWAWASPIWIPT